MRYTISDIREIDYSYKPGTDYDGDAIKRAELYEDRARGLTARHLETLGVGDPENDQPISLPVLNRIIEELAVTYRNPVSRRLVIDDEELAEDDQDVRDMQTVIGRSQFDLQWQLIDEMRALHRQVLVCFAESSAHRAVQFRMFETYNVMRVPDPSAADILDADQAIALQIRGDSTPGGANNLFQLWEQFGSIEVPDWRMTVVNEAGELSGAQPYPDEGRTPFGILPALNVYDEVSRGRAWLPGGDSRVSSALAVNAIINDLLKLIKDQAHQTIVSAGDDQRGAPDASGPDRIWQTPSDHQVYALATNPKISESSQVLDQTLRMWAAAEGLPADRFMISRVIPVSGAALRVLDRPMQIRRDRQLGLASEYEQRAYDKFRAVHNTVASDYGLPTLRPDTRIRIAVARAEQFASPAELQDLAFRDIAAAYGDPLEYIQGRRGCSREEARLYLRRARESLAEFPPAANPGSMVVGAGPAIGVTEKAPGEFNPDIAGSSDQNSIVGALAAMDNGSNGSPVEDPEGTEAIEGGGMIPNGAQLQSQLEVLQAAATGEIPRNTAMAFLMLNFGMSRSEAESLVPPAGFKPAIDPRPQPSNGA